MAEVICPEIVKLPALLMVVSAASVIVPGKVSAVDEELINAPLLFKPAPLKLNALAITKLFRSAVKPELTVTRPVPNAPFVTEPAEPVEATPALSKPPETVVPPECVLAPDNVMAPPAAFTVRGLPPEIVPEKFAAKALNVSVLEPVVVNVWSL